MNAVQHWLWLALPSALALSAASASGCRANDVVLLDLPGESSDSAGAGAGGTTSGGALNPGTAGATPDTGGAHGAGSPNGGSGGALGAGANSGVAPSTGGSGGASAGGGGTAGTSANSAGSAGTGGCFDNDDCPGGNVCDKPGCTAESGVCVDNTFLCPPRVEPVCGCDNVTYWNDCVRLRSGARKAADVECSRVIACRTGADCGVPGAFCARLLAPRQQCDHVDPGKCWVLPEPERCQGPSSLRFVECKPPPGGPGGPGMLPACLDLRGAIRSEKPQGPLPPDAPCAAD